MRENNESVFLELVKAGLWENCELTLAACKAQESDWPEILRLAEEQSVVGLITAGIECFKSQIQGFTVPIVVALQFVGHSMQLEQWNQAMNIFIGKLVGKMREAGIYTLLVKGQGVAQCYERPLLRSCGDVDLFLSEENYQKAKTFLTPLAEHVDEEDATRKHLGMTINSWIVELHGTVHTNFSKKINAGLDEVQRDIFRRGEVRSWNNSGVQVFLPTANNDAILIFTHILEHFYVGGVGLRQICDWCRLLWTYRAGIDASFLENRLQKMGIVTEWRAFAAVAVAYLGMPVEAMPLYSKEMKWAKKAKKIIDIVMETGNMGHNIDDSYRMSSSKWKSLCITFWRRLKAFVRLSSIFPGNAPRFFVTYVMRRTKANI